jgi:hypothetical protein
MQLHGQSFHAYHMLKKTCRLPLYKLQINDNIQVQYNVMFLIKVIGEN